MSEEEVLERIKRDGRYLPADDFEYTGSHSRIALLCEKHGRFEIMLSNLCYKDGRPKKGCMDCGFERSADFHRNSASTVLERIRIDGRFTPADDFVYVNTKTPINLICPKHGKFQTLFSNVCYLDGSPKKHACKECANEAKALAKFTPDEGQSLLDNFPEVASWWADDNPDSPGDVNAFANYKRNFVCPTCLGPYRALVGSVSTQFKKRGHYCPYCSNKRIHPDLRNSLARRNPELCKEWHEDNELTPEQVTEGSEYRAIWKCSNSDCDNVWEATVQSRTGPRGTGCAPCSGRGFDRSEPGFVYLFSVISPDSDILLYKLGISNVGVSRRFREFTQSVLMIPRWSQCSTEIVEQIEFEIGADAEDLERSLKRTHEIRYFPDEQYVGMTESFIVNPLEYARSEGWL